MLAHRTVRSPTVAGSPAAGDDRPYWVALSRLEGLGPRGMEKLRRLGGARAVWEAPASAWLEAGLPAGLAEARRAISVEACWREVEALGVSVLTWDDPDYPAPLSQLPDRPFVLYVRGRLEPQDARALAVVGTRRPTAYGREAARSLVSGLVLHGFTIVSGLARGLDSLAHRTALEAGGRTVAVLGSGLDRLYPAENAALVERIAGQGAVLSEFPLGMEARKGHFPRRNRLVSGLALGTLVVEAGERSGALITARLALEQGREVFAVPGSIFSAQSAGTHRLIAEGARPVRTVADVVGLEAPAAEEGPAGEAGLLGLLSGEPQHLNEIVRSSGRPAAEVSAELVLLEVRGLVRRVSGNDYVRG